MGCCNCAPLLQLARREISRERRRLGWSWESEGATKERRERVCVGGGGSGRCSTFGGEGEGQWGGCRLTLKVSEGVLAKRLDDLQKVTRLRHLDNL